MVTGRAKSNSAVTLRDVAARSGVSVATASQALSGSGRMTDETRRRVQQVSEQLGYVPNALGRGLRTGRTHALGIHNQDAATALSNLYFRDFLAGVIQVGHAQDHDVAVLSSNKGAPRRTAPRVDGVIVTDPLGDDTRARELMESRLPVVAGEYLPKNMPSCAVVAADHETAVREILDDAHARGARWPLLVAPDANSGWGDVLRATVERWCSERGLHSLDVETPFAQVRPDTLRPQLRTLLEQHPDIDLVLVSSHREVSTALDALRDVGREPGRDILLAACADSPTLGARDLPVTAVELPALALGRACAERLLELLAGEDGGGTVRTVPTVVHHRASTDTVLHLG